MGWLTQKFWDHAPRWCSSCRSKQPVSGGEYRATDADGLKQIWVCGRCKERHAGH
jgi:hypothetical protein